MTRIFGATEPPERTGEQEFHMEQLQRIQSGEVSLVRCVADKAIPPAMVAPVNAVVRTRGQKQGEDICIQTLWSGSALIDTGQNLGRGGVLMSHKLFSALGFDHDDVVNLGDFTLFTAENGRRIPVVGMLLPNLMFLQLGTGEQIEIRPVISAAVEQGLNIGVGFLETIGAHINVRDRMLRAPNIDATCPLTGSEGPWVKISDNESQVCAKLHDSNGAREIVLGTGSVYQDTAKLYENWQDIFPVLNPGGALPITANVRAPVTIVLPPATSAGPGELVQKVVLPPWFKNAGIVQVLPGEAEETEILMPAVSALSLDPDGSMYTEILLVNMEPEARAIEAGDLLGTAELIGFSAEGEGGAVHSVQSGERTKAEDGLHTAHIWRQLNLDTNPILNSNPTFMERAKTLVSRFPDIFVSETEKVGRAPEKYGFKIDLKPGAAPTRQSPRPLHPHLEQDLRQQLDAWLEEGVIERSSSSWASPLVPVRKKDGSVRWCVDFRRLNSLTVPDATPVPSIESQLLTMGGSKIFSTLDASQAYMALPIDPESRPLTAFCSKFGLFQFARMAFGLRNAGSKFNSMSLDMKEDVDEEGVSNYLDDWLGHSATFEEHMIILEKLFQVHRLYGILLNPSKTFLFQEEVTFLGFKVSQKGILPTDDFLGKIKGWPLPETPKGLMSFLGFVQYYSAFLPCFSELTVRMNGMKNRKVLAWSPEAKNDFFQLKEAFLGTSGRSHLILDKKSRTYQGLIIDIDFSATAVAAVLSQDQDGNLRFIGCKSRKLKDYERRYHSTKGELMGMVFGLEKFQHILACQHFLVRTDNLSVAHWETV